MSIIILLFLLNGVNSVKRSISYLSGMILAHIVLGVPIILGIEAASQGFIEIHNTLTYIACLLIGLGFIAFGLHKVFKTKKEDSDEFLHKIPNSLDLFAAFLLGCLLTFADIPGIFVFGAIIAVFGNLIGDNLILGFLSLIISTIVYLIPLFAVFVVGAMMKDKIPTIESKLKRFIKHGDELLIPASILFGLSFLLYSTWGLI